MGYNGVVRDRGYADLYRWPELYLDGPHRAAALGVIRRRFGSVAARAADRGVGADHYSALLVTDALHRRGAGDDEAARRSVGCVQWHRSQEATPRNATRLYALSRGLAIGSLVLAWQALLLGPTGPTGIPHAALMAVYVGAILGLLVLKRRLSLGYRSPVEDPSLDELLVELLDDPSPRALDEALAPLRLTYVPDPPPPVAGAPPPLDLVDGPACRGSVVPTGPPTVPWATPSRVALTAA